MGRVNNGEGLSKSGAFQHGVSDDIHTTDAEQSAQLDRMIDEDELAPVSVFQSVADQDWSQLERWDREVKALTLPASSVTQLADAAAGGVGGLVFEGSETLCLRPSATIGGPLERFLGLQELLTVLDEVWPIAQETRAYFCSHCKCSAPVFLLDGGLRLEITQDCGLDIAKV